MDSFEEIDARFKALREQIRSELAEVVESQNEQLLQRHTTLKPLLSVKDVARTLQVSERTVETLIGVGHLRPLWVQGQRRFHPDAVDAYLRSCERAAQKLGIRRKR